jgi:uncharacterized protein (TIGR03437 family)
MFLRSALCVAAIGMGAHAQQPFVFYRGVLNAASFMPQGLPGGGIARGSAFTIFGRSLGPASSPTLAFPLQTTLGGVAVTITGGSQTVNAIPIFVGPGQINAIMPSNAPLGNVTLRVTVNNVRSNPSTIRVVESAPGLFSVNPGGLGPAVAQNFITSAEQPVNSLQQPARAGQTITLWGTGLGPVTFGDNVAPVAGNLPIRTEAFVGGKAARVVYNGRSPCCASIDMVIFEVPADAPTGCWVPVYVRTAGANVSNTVTMAIGGDGTSCTEPQNPLARALINGGSISSFVAARLSVRHDIGVRQPRDALSEFVGGWTAEERKLPFNFNPMFSLPPPGTCTTYSTAGELASRTSLPGVTQPTGRALDGGAATFTGSKGARPFFSSPFASLKVAWLNGSISGISPPSQTYLDPGSYMLTTRGGANVGAINANIDVGQPLVWTNRDQTSTVDRARGFSVSWTGVATADRVLIAGLGGDLPTNSSTGFVCVADPGQSSFNVPADVLANIPRTRPRTAQSRGAIYVGKWPLTAPTMFNASGIDSGVLLPLFMSGKTVSFQ